MNGAKAWKITKIYACKPEKNWKDAIQMDHNRQLIIYSLAFSDDILVNITSHSLHLKGLSPSWPDSIWFKNLFSSLIVSLSFKDDFVSPNSSFTSCGSVDKETKKFSGLQSSLKLSSLSRGAFW